MKPMVWKTIKLFNVLAGFCLALWLIKEGFGIFALILAIYITYFNSVIDEILKGSDKEGC